MDSESKFRKYLFNEVSLFLAIAGSIVAGFMWLTTPQTESNLVIALLQQQLETQGETVKDLTKTQQNDIQEVKSELQGLRNEVGILRESVVRLSTVIEERIPKR